MKIIIPEREHGNVCVYDKDSIQRYNGWPSVCRDDRGVLYAVASTMRLTHGDPTGKNGMWLSFNEGKTWTPTVIIHDSFYDDRDTGITYVDNGRLIATFITDVPNDNYHWLLSCDWFQGPQRDIGEGVINSWDTIEKDDGGASKKRNDGSFIMISDDYGVTWTKPAPIKVFAPHGVTKCADGRLVYLGKVDFSVMTPDGGSKEVAMMTSYDRGDSWEMTGYVPLPHDLPDWAYLHEPHVAELPNGRLIGALRAHSRPVEPESTVYITFSDDKGKTWSEPRAIDGVDGLPPHVLVHSSGAVIVSYGCRTAGRLSERAAVSYDGGETFTEDYVLDDNINENKQRDLGYPASVELSDGSILTVYYQAPPDDWCTGVLYTKWKLNPRE